MTNETKQTAVEFLQECLNIHLSHQQQMQFEGLFQQAKEMENEQTKNRAIESYHLYTKYLYLLSKIGGATVEMDFEKYYNETYGGNK